MITSLDSPFEIGALAGDPASLPPAFRAQFLGSPEDGLETHLVGTMDRVWHRHRWLWPVLWTLAKFDTLFPETGRAIPATMTVRNYRDAAGRPTQTWERTFAFGDRVRHFDARITLDPAHGRVIEHTGPGGRLAVPWRMALVNQRLQIDALSVSLRLGRWLVRLPDFCCVRVRAIETADPLRSDQIHIDLSLTHPWLGPIFGYEGTFRAARRPVPA